VENLLGPKAALLQVLFAGPGYGLELIDRVRERTGGRLRLGQGSVYPALRDLEAHGLARSWTGRPRGGGAGRPRVYYELTVAGVSAAAALREAMAAFIEAGAAEASPPDARALEAGLTRGLDLSAFARSLRRASRSGARP